MHFDKNSLTRYMFGYLKSKFIFMLTEQCYGKHDMLLFKSESVLIFHVVF